MGFEFCALRALWGPQSVPTILLIIKMQLVWASQVASSCSASLRAVGRSGRAGTALVLRSSLRCGCSAFALGLCGCSVCFYLLALAALQGHSCCIRLRIAPAGLLVPCHRCALVSISARCARFGAATRPLALNFPKNHLTRISRFSPQLAVFTPYGVSGIFALLLSRIFPLATPSPAPRLAFSTPSLPLRYKFGLFRTTSFKHFSASFISVVVSVR